MKLRDLYKTLGPNDGTRTLYESVLVPEVVQAITDWCRAVPDMKAVLIGGLALSYYIKPRTTQDVDFLFLNITDIPKVVKGFKRTRTHAFQHEKTHVEIEVITPEYIGTDYKLVEEIYTNARIENGIRIATPSGLVASKLGRYSRQDQADIEELVKNNVIDLSKYTLTSLMKKRYNTFSVSE